MATVEQGVDFAIESDADALLSHLSDGVSNLVLTLASKETTNRTPSGVPLVTKSDISKTAHFLSNVLREAEQSCATDAELRDILARLRERIESILAEPEDAR